MKTGQTIKGFALAATAASFFAMAPMSATAGEGNTGHCMGANACKGHSDCKTANSACKGQNACKGQGFKETTKQKCDELGGDFKKPEQS